MRIGRHQCHSFQDNKLTTRRIGAPIPIDPVFDEITTRDRADQIRVALSQLPGNIEAVIRRLYLDSTSGQTLERLAVECGVVRQTVARWRDQGLADLRRILGEL
jgi:DNA-directed RNA polymerase sigma subunit (sigma70/sigma32)